jgi:hypothetical protein
LNEPDEDLERHVPEEPLPERDVLLEALVDAETETKPRRRFSKTLIAACVFSGLGVWQIVHVSKGGEPVFQLTQKAKTAPTKLRSDGRAPTGRVLPSTDPIAAYLERAKRGMTDQEIRWMIEDFQAAGLDEEEHSLEGTLRAKQQLWYLEALTEALQLSQEQRAQAKTKMDTMRVAEFELLEKEFEEEAANYPNSHPDVRTALESTYLAVVSKANWLENDDYAPWNLCDLSKEQLQLTLHRWKGDKGNTGLEKVAAGEVDPFGEVDSPKWIKLHGVAMQDPISGNIIEGGKGIPGKEFDTQSLFECTIPLSDLFPLTLNQKFVGEAYSYTGLCRLCQPAQLRMALLLHPTSAHALLQDLAEPRSISWMHEGDFTKPADELPPNTTAPETPVDPLPEPDPK